MNQIKLLDCTLRDGGYINDWNFGHDNIVNIFERLVDVGVDIIEVGFLDDRRPFDMDRSIMPDTDSVEKIYGKLDRKGAMIVGMIDYGTCSLDNIKPASESYLDGIRVIFKKHLRVPAMEYCRALKEKGYKVFAQLVSVTSYDDEEMLDLIRLANDVKPYAVSMVDTYGLMHSNNLMHYFNLLNDNLNPEIGLGYHAHNNFQMGYANCISMLANKIDRTMVVDGTIYGMGKSAGNAPLELIAMHMNNSFGTKYQVGQILEAIDTSVSEFYQTPTWGYSIFYFIAAYNDCHPNYVSYLMEKRTLSIKSINEILGSLQGEKKLLYDKNYIEELYVSYQSNEINDDADTARLREALAGKDILVLGPGASIKKQKKEIADYIEEKKPVVISINFASDNFRPDYIFLSNSKRYVQLATRLSRESHSVIATSNVTGTSPEAFEYVLNFSSLMDADAEFIDNSLAMMLKALIRFDCKKVTLAGFDGYSARRTNFFASGMEYDFIKKKAEDLNAYMTAFLESVKDKIEVSFLTETRYGE